MRVKRVRCKTVASQVAYCVVSQHNLSPRLTERPFYFTLITALVIYTYNCTSLTVRVQQLNGGVNSTQALDPSLHAWYGASAPNLSN
jgi:hypothetical protein